MHTTPIVAAVALLASVGLAAPTKRSVIGPFTLRAISAYPNTTYNNVTVGTCHVGAGAESWCIFPPNDGPFTFNGTGNYDLSGDEYGPLIWDLVSSAGGSPDKQALQWIKNDTSVVQAGFFGAVPLDQSPPVSVAFTNGGLGVVRNNRSEQSLYVCPVSFLGHQFPTVSYIHPEDSAPTDCEKVFIHRYFEN